MRRLALAACRWLLIGAAVAGAAVTAVSALPSDAWWVALPDFPRVQALGRMALVLALLVALPGRGRAASLLAAAGLAAACLYDGVLVAPYLLPVPVAVAAGACPADRRMRVLEVNVQMTNWHDDALLDEVRAADPDVVWFQETDAWWENELAPLSATLPYGKAQAQPNYYGVHLFSRRPLAEAEIHDLTGSHDPSVSATTTTADGTRVAIYAIHPHPPLVGQSAAERDAQLMGTALVARSDADRHLLVGDMNAVPWSGTLGRAEALGNFRDPRVGRGLFVTWNAKSEVLKWPLDQILPGPGLTIAGLSVLPAFGSDHRPLLADLCAAPGTVPPPPEAAPDALARARATVERGQGRAAGPGAEVPAGSETGEPERSGRP